MGGGFSSSATNIFQAKSIKSRDSVLYSSGWQKNEGNERKNTSREKQNLPARKKDFRSGKNISKIYTETNLKWQANRSKIIGGQIDIKKRKNFIEKELGTVLKNNNWKAAGLVEIPSTKKFHVICLQLCNAVYKQITTEKWTKDGFLPFSQVFLISPYFSFPQSNLWQDMNLFCLHLFRNERSPILAVVHSLELSTLTYISAQRF